MTLAKLLEQTRDGGELLREAREKARPACIAAVRKLEAALVEALDGEKLKGLPKLDETERARFYAARARGKRIDERLTDKEVLVVAQDGRLHMASVRPEVSGAFLGSPVESRPAADDELLAEDVEDVARAVEEVLGRHLALIAKSAERYERLADLARKLEAALVA